MSPTLTVSSASGTRSFPVTGTVKIGRAPDNDVQIDDPKASRYHAALTLAEPQCLFRDLGSSNGSQVNGRSVEPNVDVAIRPGDEIVIADSTLKLEQASDLGDAPTAPPVNRTRIDPAPPVAAAPPVTPPASAPRRGGSDPFGSPPRPRPARPAPPVGAPPPPPPQPRAGAEPAVWPAPTHVAVPARPPRSGLAVIAAIGVVIAFIGFMIADAIDTRLLEPSYYNGVLDHSNAYHRAYTEIATDPALKGQVDDLLCGAGSLLPIDVIGAVQEIVPETVLQPVVEASVAELIDYLKHHSSLNLSLDVTPFVGGIGSTGSLPFGIRSLLPGSDCGSQQNLQSGQFVHETTIGGETHYLLGPPADVQSSVSNAVWTIHTASRMAGWGRPVMLVAGLAFLVLIALATFPDFVAMARWTGGALFAAGAFVLAGWLIGSRIMEHNIIHAALGDSSSLPNSYQQLFKDVLGQAATDLAPTFVIPSVVVLVAGGALITASVVASRRRRLAAVA